MTLDRLDKLQTFDSLVTIPILPGWEYTALVLAAVVPPLLLLNRWACEAWPQPHLITYLAKGQMFPWVGYLKGVKVGVALGYPAALGILILTGYEGMRPVHWEKTSHIRQWRHKSWPRRVGELIKHIFAFTLLVWFIALIWVPIAAFFHRLSPIRAVDTFLFGCASSAIPLMLSGRVLGAALAAPRERGT
jgi:hypothetical protein